MLYGRDGVCVKHLVWWPIDPLILYLISPEILLSLWFRVSHNWQTFAQMSFEFFSAAAKLWLVKHPGKSMSSVSHLCVHRPLVSRVILTSTMYLRTACSREIYSCAIYFSICYDWPNDRYTYCLGNVLVYLTFLPCYFPITCLHMFCKCSFCKTILSQFSFVILKIM